MPVVAVLHEEMERPALGIIGLSFLPGFVEVAKGKGRRGRYGSHVRLLAVLMSARLCRVGFVVMAAIHRIRSDSEIYSA